LIPIGSYLAHGIAQHAANHLANLYTNAQKILSRL
jgi:hypothetical protein